MSKIEELAEKLLRAEQGPPEFPYSPYSRPRAKLMDLWPADRERYIRMAESVLIHEEP